MKDVKDGWLDVWVGWVDKIKKAIQEEEPNSCNKIRHESVMYRDCEETEIYSGSNISLLIKN